MDKGLPRDSRIVGDVGRRRHRSSSFRIRQLGGKKSAIEIDSSIIWREEIVEVNSSIWREEIDT